MYIYITCITCTTPTKAYVKLKHCVPVLAISFSPGPIPKKLNLCMATIRIQHGNNGNSSD